MWKRNRTDGGSKHEKERAGGKGVHLHKCVRGLLNGTPRGVWTEPLRLIGHSNVTKSLPK